MNWYESAENELDELLADEQITPEEYKEEMRELMREVRAEAEESAYQARNDYYN